MMLFAVDPLTSSLVNLAFIVACGIGLAKLCLLLLAWNRDLRRKLALTEASLAEARLAEAAAAKAAAAARPPARAGHCPTCGSFPWEPTA